jgi:hypothetical protein
MFSFKHPDIVDFKKVHKDHYRNVTCDIKNNKIIWNKVKHIQLRKEKPGSMFVKYDFSQEFMEIECTPKTKSPAQCKDLMSSNTDEGMLLRVSHKILVGPHSHSKGNMSLFHH